MKIVLFADCRSWIKPSIAAGADVGVAGRKPGPPTIPVNVLDRSGSETLESDGIPAIPALMSPVKAAIPCWVPVARAPATVIGLTGGITPNGVGTFAGPVDQPWVVLP